jgi:hypothetical protein
MLLDIKRENAPRGFYYWKRDRVVEDGEWVWRDSEV